MRLALCLLAVAMLATLISAPFAHADSALRLSVSADPVRDLPVEFSVAGSTPGADMYGNEKYDLWVRARPAAAGPCGPSEILDPAPANAADLAGDFSEHSGSGPFDVSWTAQFPVEADIGSYLVCAWLVDLQGTGEVVAAGQLPFSMRRPNLHLDLSVPAHTKVGVRRPFAASGEAEAPAHLEVQLLPPYVLVCGNTCHKKYVHRCAADPEAEATFIGLSDVGSAYPVFSESVPAGHAFRFARRLVAKSPGTFRACGWMQEGGPDGPVGAFEESTVKVRGPAHR